VTRAVNERDVTLQPVFTSTAFTLARWINLLLALVRPVACWARALGVVALVDFRVGVSKLDGDIPLEFVLETDGLYTGDGLDYRTLSVSDVPDCSNVDCGLARDDLR
jgi:hypothetical protein